jgi:SAM-dependent methyltransferase
VTTMNSGSQLTEREVIGCPVCAGEHQDVLFEARDRLVGLPGAFPVVRCRSCSLVFLNPRPSSTALAGYYPTEYYPVAQGRETPEALDVARGLLERVESIADQGCLRILDAGCGTGLFLKMARDRGHDVQGIELSQSAVHYGQVVYGVPIQQGTLETNQFPPGQFDVVTMWHVLEHTPDPIAALRAAEKLLKPGGSLLFAVPNFESIEASIFGRRWFSLDAPRHLIHFSPATAREATERAGLRVKRVEHSSGTAGMVYSLMGDLTGISLKLRGTMLSEGAYRRISSALSWIVWPFCAGFARVGRGGAIEVYAKKPVR